MEQIIEMMQIKFYGNQTQNRTQDKIIEICKNIEATTGIDNIFQFDLDKNTCTIWKTHIITEQCYYINLAADEDIYHMKDMTCRLVNKIIQQLKHHFCVKVKKYE